MDLEGGVAVVTGGTGGLGRRILHKLVRAGVHAAVCYRERREEAEQVSGVQNAASHRLSLITGGPGTGKTASLRAIAGVAAGRGVRVAGFHSMVVWHCSHLPPSPPLWKSVWQPLQSRGKSAHLLFLWQDAHFAFRCFPSRTKPVVECWKLLSGIGERTWFRPL